MILIAAGKGGGGVGKWNKMLVLDTLAYLKPTLKAYVQQVWHNVIEQQS